MKRTIDMNRPRPAAPVHSAGFTLLEVLISLLVFSFGLLGMAGLTALSVKTNHSAYLRTQANFIAGAMADRMRGNIAGVWGGNYTASYPSGATSLPCNTTAGCSPAQVAQRDQAAFDSQLAQFLPNGSGTIACTKSPGVATTSGDLLRRRPYHGTCVMNLAWNEAQLEAGTESKAYKLTWAFQP